MKVVVGGSSGRVSEGHLADSFRMFMSSWFSGVAVVTSAGTDGRLHGLTCTSMSSVALDPPTLLVCLRIGSGTFAAVRERGAFVVNLLHTSGQAAAERFGSPEPDRFSHVDWRPAPLTGLPWLAGDAFAMAECRVADTAFVGDHAIIFGTVENVMVEDGRPLLYGARAFHTPRRTAGAS